MQGNREILTDVRRESGTVCRIHRDVLYQYEVAQRMGSGFLSIDEVVDERDEVTDSF
jgi:hypothetical protein